MFTLRKKLRDANDRVTPLVSTVPKHTRRVLMGYFMKEHDIYVSSLLDELNLRFAPPQGKDSHYGGIEELVALQKEFKIFKKGRSFKTSVSVLNIGARNNEAKNRLHDYFGNLSKHDSNISKQNGDVALVNALIKNLAANKPLPVYSPSMICRRQKEILDSSLLSAVAQFHISTMTIS